MLLRDWQQRSSLWNTCPQHTITLEIKQLVFDTFLSQSLPDEAASVAAVGLQTRPFPCIALPLCYVLFVCLAISTMPHVVDGPHMSLWGVNQVFVTCMPVCFGIPVPPHTCTPAISLGCLHWQRWTGQVSSLQILPMPRGWGTPHILV